MRSRSLIMAGILGAAAGMYLMNMMERNEMEMDQTKRRVARRARRSASRLENAYETGRQAVMQGVNAFRH